LTKQESDSIVNVSKTLLNDVKRETEIKKKVINRRGKQTITK
jgi:hypothetical protein